MNKLQMSCIVIHGRVQVIHVPLGAVSLLQTNPLNPLQLVLQLLIKELKLSIIQVNISFPLSLNRLPQSLHHINSVPFSLIFPGWEQVLCKP